MSLSHKSLLQSTGSVWWYAQPIKKNKICSSTGFHLFWRELLILLCKCFLVCVVETAKAYVWSPAAWTWPAIYRTHVPCPARWHAWLTLGCLEISPPCCGGIHGAAQIQWANYPWIQVLAWTGSVLSLQTAASGRLLLKNACSEGVCECVCVCEVFVCAPVFNIFSVHVDLL